jgi:hypothetical protein
MLFYKMESLRAKHNLKAIVLYNMESLRTRHSLKLLFCAIWRNWKRAQPDRYSLLARQGQHPLSAQSSHKNTDIRPKLFRVK